MSDQHISYSEANYEQVYVVGIKLQPGAHHADLFALVLYNEVARNDENRPLTRAGRIVFFLDPTAADRVLELGDAAFRKYKPARQDIAYVYDVPRVLSIVTSENADEPGILADFINELLDFVAAIDVAIPISYRQMLHAMADSATFSKDLSMLGSSEARASARDALLWCFGAIVSHCDVSA